MIRNLFFLLAISPILLNGCTLAPKYTRPAAPIPDQWPTGPAYQDPAATAAAPVPADLEWRQFFTDQRLQTIIATALQNNRDLRVAALNVERARAMYRVQRAELYPTVQTDASAIRQRVMLSGANTSGMVTLESYGINLAI